MSLINWLSFEPHSIYALKSGKMLNICTSFLLFQFGTSPINHSPTKAGGIFGLGFANNKKTTYNDLRAFKAQLIIPIVEQPTHTQSRHHESALPAAKPLSLYGSLAGAADLRPTGAAERCCLAGWLCCAAFIITQRGTVYSVGRRTRTHSHMVLPPHPTSA